MTQYGFYFDSTRCAGCHTCEAACRDYNDLDLDFSFRRIYEIEGGGWKQAADGAWTTDSYTYYVSLSCQHCDDPACMHVCPTGAMHRADNGVVSVDAKKCIGCGYCELACPYGNPKVDRKKGHSTKCDGCASRLGEGKQPICVEACSMRALKFGPVDEMSALGERAALAPLPDPAVTTPNLFIKACAKAQPLGSTDCVIANTAEVR